MSFPVVSCPERSVSSAALSQSVSSESSSGQVSSSGYSMSGLQVHVEETRQWVVGRRVHHQPHVGRVRRGPSPRRERIWSDGARGGAVSPAAFHTPSPAWHRHVSPALLTGTRGASLFKKQPSVEKQLGHRTESDVTAHTFILGVEETHLIHGSHFDTKQHVNAGLIITLIKCYKRCTIFILCAQDIYF